MDEDGFFVDKRICIFGLGLMGGSLALAVRNRCRSLSGVDQNPETLALALENKTVDVVSDDLARLLPETDLLVLAAPVRTNLAVIENLPHIYNGHLSLIDLSSTKRKIVTAMNRLPKRFSALGGHPMCGKEVSGLIHAEADLFQGSNFALAETGRTTPALRGLIEDLVLAIGAVPLWLNAETHDRWSAASSHLPYLIAAALAASTPKAAAPLISTGYRSTSRLAASDTKMMLDILTTNREPVLNALGRYRRVIEEFETSLQDSPENLHQCLESARRNHQKLLDHPP